MRMLFTTTSGAGHFLPLVPLADAACAAGHDVGVAAPAESTGMVEGVGHRHLPFGGVPPDDPRRGAVFGALPTLPQMEAMTLVGREIFGRLNTSYALPDMVRTVHSWRPDVVISDAAELAGGLAAEAADVPSMRVHPGLASRTDFDAAIASGVVELRAELGLPADPDGRLLRVPPQVAYFPEELDEPAPGAAPVLRIRDPRHVAGAGGAREDAVYVTLGSEAASMPFFADTLRAAVAAVTAAGLAAVVTTGRDGDPAVLADIPGDVRAERWVDPSVVLPIVRAVVCHAGAGTTLAALAAGLPVVAVPLFAEQPLNAARIAAVDAGVVVLPGPDLAARLESAVRAVTAEAPPGAARMAAAMAALPDVSAALAVAEGLVRR